MLRSGVSLPAVKELLGHKDLRMTLRYIQVTQNDLQREFHAARLRLPNHPGMFPLALVPCSDNAAADLPAIVRSLAATRHLLEMHRRQLPAGPVRRQLEHLANRLVKIAGELDQLAAAEK
jgi:hypothetical protein